MPLYEYQCKSCGYIFENLGRVKDKTIRCERCRKGRATRVITIGHGGIQTDTAGDKGCLWLNHDTTKVLQPDGEKRIETRREYKDYLKKKNISAVG